MKLTALSRRRSRTISPTLARLASSTWPLTPGLRGRPADCTLGAVPRKPRTDLPRRDGTVGAPKDHAAPVAQQPVAGQRGKSAPAAPRGGRSADVARPLGVEDVGSGRFAGRAPAAQDEVLRLQDRRLHQVREGAGVSHAQISGKGLRDARFIASSRSPKGRGASCHRQDRATRRAPRPSVARPSAGRPGRRRRACRPCRRGRPSGA